MPDNKLALIGEVTLELALLAPVVGGSFLESASALAASAAMVVRLSLAMALALATVKAFSRFAFASFLGISWLADWLAGWLAGCLPARC